MANNKKYDKTTFEIHLNFTTSKLMAYIMVILATVMAWFMGEPQIIMVIYPLAAGLLGLKSWSQGVTERKNIQMEETKVTSGYYQSVETAKKTEEQKEQINKVKTEEDLSS